jgi:hypothetical protein
MGKSGSRVNIGNVDINIQPKIKQVEGNEESLPQQYRECLLRNPLLGRIEGAQKAVGWERTKYPHVSIVGCGQEQREFATTHYGIRTRVRVSTPAKCLIGN